MQSSHFALELLDAARNTAAPVFVLYFLPRAPLQLNLCDRFLELAHLLLACPPHLLLFLPEILPYDLFYRCYYLINIWRGSWFSALLDCLDLRVQVEYASSQFVDHFNCFPVVVPLL